MNSQISIAAFALFWILAGAILFSQLKWSMLAYILIAQIDLSGPAFASTSGIGFGNTIKIVVLPAILLWRMGWLRSRHAHWPFIARVWIALAAYAAVSTAWSPYPLSAVKMMGYFVCPAMLLIVFRFGWSRGWFTGRMVALAAWSTIVLAAAQTYLFGNVFGSPEGRFTVFADAQGFAAFLLSLLILLLCTRSSQWWIRATELAVVLAIVLTGSRYAFLAMILLFIGFSVLSLLRQSRQFDVAQILKRTLLGVLPAVLLVGLIANYFPTSRLQELISFAGDQDATVADIGTLAWRLSVYQEAWSQVSRRSWGQFLTGSGTSSSADVLIATGFHYGEFDPNRSMHDEFLRSLYEWGVIGLVLLILGLAQLVKIACREYRVHHSWQGMAVLALFPAILFSFMSDNILTAAGQPGGTGYVLVLAALASSLAPSSRPAAQWRAQPSEAAGHLFNPRISDQKAISP